MLPSRQFWSLCDTEDGKERRNGDIEAITYPDIIRVRSSHNRQRYGISVKGRDGPALTMLKSDASDFYAQHWPDLKSSGVRGVQRTLRKLVTSKIKILALQRRFIRPVMNQIYLTMYDIPEGYRYAVSWWKYLTDIVLSTKSLDRATREWKRHCLWVRSKQFGKVDFYEEYPSEHPPLIIDFLRKVPEQLSDFELSKITLYTTTRSLPAGSKRVQEAAISKTLSVLQTVPDAIPQEVKQEVRKYSKIAGQEIRNCLSYHFKRNDGHVSFSNTGCYENPGTKGGKYTYLMEKYHEDWLLTCPSDDSEQYILPTGNSVVFHANVPRWKGEIDCEGLDLDLDFAEAIDSSGFMNPELYGCDSKRLSLLLFTWSYVELLKKGLIDELGSTTGRPIQSRLCSVGEPGGKVRIPTVTYCAVILYLQPYSHIMRGLLEADPTLSAGLGAENQIWDYVKRHKDQPLSANEGLLMGDLEESTNYVQHELGLIHMEAFHAGLGITNEYMLNAVKFCLQPMVIDHDGVEYLTSCGAPMGMPGTKIILHSLGKAIECMASKRSYPLSREELNLSRYANAGDDIMKPGPLEELRRHQSAALFYRVKPSEDKWGIYTIAGMYCEGVVSLRGNVTTDPHKSEKSFMIDSLSGRLMSPETKNRFSDEETNPTFGKGKALKKQMEWSLYDKTIVYKVFRESFKDYGTAETLYALPPKLGGIGLYEDDERIYNATDDRIKSLIEMIRTEDNNVIKGNLIKRVKLLGKPFLYSRGRPIDEDEENKEIKDLLREFTPVVTLKEAEAASDIEVPANWRFHKRKANIMKLGWRDFNQDFKLLTAKPYWVVPDKVRKWGTAPLERRIRKAIDGLALPEVPPKEVFCQFLAECDFWEESYFYREEFMTIAIETLSAMGQVQKLNLSGKNTGMSISFGIPNDTIIFRKGRPIDG